MNEIEIRLQQLEKENQALRAALSRKKRRFSWPDSLIERHPIIQYVVGRKACTTSGKKYDLEDSFKIALSKAVKLAVFDDLAEKHGAKKVCVKLEDLNECDFDLWVNTLDGIFGVLEHAIRSRGLIPAYLTTKENEEE